MHFPLYLFKMLDAMLTELDYLINKYSGSEWNSKSTANRLVDLLQEHRQLVQIERNQAGSRALRDQDFLGPKERQKRKTLKLIEDGKDPDEIEEEEKEDFSQYFRIIEAKLLEKKRRDMRDTARKVAAERGLGQRDNDMVWSQIEEAAEEALAEVTTVEAQEVA